MSQCPRHENFSFGDHNEKKWLPQKDQIQRLNMRGRLKKQYPEAGENPKPQHGRYRGRWNL